MKPAMRGAVAGGAVLLALFAGWKFWGDDPDVVKPSGDQAVVQQPSGEVLTTNGGATTADDGQNVQAVANDAEQLDTEDATQAQSTDADGDASDADAQATQTASATVPQDDTAGADDGSAQSADDTRIGAGDDPEETSATSEGDGAQTAALDPNAGQASSEQQLNDESTDQATDGSDDSDGATPSQTNATEAEPKDPLAPRFDIVRVDPEGQTVLAGKAPPGSIVEIVLDGVVVATETADAQGGFVTILDIALSGDAQSLQLRIPREDGDTDVAETTVGTTEPEGSSTPQEDTSEAEAQNSATDQQETEQQTAQLGDTEPEVQSTEDTLSGPNLVNGKIPPVGAELSADTAAGDAGTLAETETQQDATPAQPQIVEGPEVPAIEIATIEPSSVSSEGVNVNAVSDDATRPGAQPQETNGIDLASLSPAPNAPGEVEAGRYRLSAPVIILPSSEEGAAPTLVQPDADELALIQPSGGDIRGVVLDRISYSNIGDVKLSGRGRAGRAIRIYGNGLLIGTTSVAQDGTWAMALASERGKEIKLFRFDEIETGGAVSSRIETPFEYSSESPKVVRERRVVIQRGDVLWRIAEQFYGEGIRYSHIYGANTELIRDPDLIYPGQVFSIPELVDANE